MKVVSNFKNINLNVLKTYATMFPDLVLGLSDHTHGDITVLGAVALGARVVEKHFTDNEKLKGPDHPHAMNPNQFAKMVNDIRLIESAKGDGIKKVEKSEKETRIIQRRSVFTITKIKKGQKFTRKNIRTLRPFIGLPASEFGKIINKKAKRNLKEFIPITLKDF